MTTYKYGICFICFKTSPSSHVVGVMRVGAPTAPEVTLRLNLTVKASSCVEPGSSFSDPQCSGKGKCVTQPSEVSEF